MVLQNQAFGTHGGFLRNLQEPAGKFMVLARSTLWNPRRVPAEATGTCKKIYGLCEIKLLEPTVGSCGTYRNLQENLCFLHDPPCGTHGGFLRNLQEPARKLMVCAKSNFWNPRWVPAEPTVFATPPKVLARFGSHPVRFLYY